MLIVLAVVGALVILGGAGCVALVAIGADAVEDAVDDAGPDTVEVSLAQFEAVENGMTSSEVEELIGGPGELMSSAGAGEFRSEVYSWDGDGSIGANVIITFSEGRVMAKAQFGLR